jgi:hypothetical protein
MKTYLQNLLRMRRWYENLFVKFITHASLLSSDEENSLQSGAEYRVSSEEKACSERHIVAVRLF